MKHHYIVCYICIVLSFALAACGGGSGGPRVSPVDVPGDGGRTLQFDFLPEVAVEHQLPFRISWGSPPFQSRIDGCPDWVTLLPGQGILAGSAPVEDRGRTFFCTYLITNSSNMGQRSWSYGLRLSVDPVDRGKWRFRTRTVEPGGPCTLPVPGTRTPVATLPHAHGGEVGQDVYELLDLPYVPFLEFDPITRQLTYIHQSASPILGTPNTHRYVVGTAGSER